MSALLGERASRRPGLVDVPLATRPFELIAPELASGAWGVVLEARERASELLAGRRVWSVNSTARGGGVAEMLRTVLPYWRGCGIDARWLVLRHGPAYFRLTKRVHNMLHGGAGALASRDRRFYERVAATVGAEAVEVMVPGDVVMLHDPQTAGLVPILKRAGVVVIWRCHIGADRPSGPVEEAWSFLRPYVGEADGLVFTRRAFVPDGLDDDRVWVAPPAIDPFSPKNQSLPGAVARAIVEHCGLVQGTGRPARLRTVPLAWGGRAFVHRRCRVTRAGPAPRLDRERLVVALSRWDRLKDPVGIIRGFARHVDDRRARLVVGGPAGTSVADDPEGSEVLREAQAAWAELPRQDRERIDLAVFPMADFAENGLIINALQRQAAVVVKKSIEEGFGLGVTEALWKARATVATRVGGHQDQIEHRCSGLLVDDPRDLAAFGAAVGELLDDPAEGRSFGAAGREVVRARFLADRHFAGWVRVMAGAIGA